MYCTENLNELFAALSKAQAQMRVAREDSNNPFHKSSYADLKSVVDASRPALCANGLAVLFRMGYQDGVYGLFARLAHISGQWLESFAPIRPAKDDIQSLGAYITYLKRYTYGALVGVVTGDEDDDGEKAMDRSKPQKTQPIVSDIISTQESAEIENLLLDEDAQYRKDLLSYVSTFLKLEKPLENFYGINRQCYKMVMTSISKRKAERNGH